jgi:hypothetical protein
MVSTWPTPMNLDAAVEQRRREDAKAENKAMLAISPLSGTFTGQVNPNPHPDFSLPPIFWTIST